MLSLLAATVLLVVLLVLGVAARASSGPYPDHITYGPLVIAFATVDRVCYLGAVVSVVVGVAAGIVLIWIGGRYQALVQVASTAALVFAGSLMVLLVNRLTRGRREP